MLKKLLFILLSIFIPVFIVATILSIFTTQPVLAQSDQIVVEKRLGRTSNIVHVGEYLTFTIRVENRASFTVTQLPLRDDYNADVLAYVDASQMPTSFTTGTGTQQIVWADLTDNFGDLAPGQVVTVVVGFIAEHPTPAVVNRAEVYDVIGDGGGLPGAGSDSDPSESIGGSAPLHKQIADGVTPTVGLPITFSITITNDGYTTMTVAPLIEDYDPAFLQYSYAIPPPDFIYTPTGVLTWTDVTSWFGDIPAFGTVNITAVFTALQSIDNTTNQAEVRGARDWYDNELAAGADDVPIQIIVGPGPTATPAPTDVPSPSNPAPTATPTPIITATVASSTGVLANRLPDTGIPPEQNNVVGTAVFALIAFSLPLGIWALRRRSRS